MMICHSDMKTDKIVGLIIAIMIILREFIIRKKTKVVYSNLRSGLSVVETRYYLFRFIPIWKSTKKSMGKKLPRRPRRS